MPDIDHGTPRGYRQHRARKVPYCEACRIANREDKRAGRQRATAAQHQWNRGKASAPTPPAVRTTGRDCTDPACGTTGPRPAPASVRVEVPGSREPARWYCPGPCASYGHALAEVRAIGDARA